jgi:P27 family predicted phage terminase small subunit
MKAAGRKPKPVELRLIQGNPGKRPVKPTPKYAPLTDHAPNELPPLGKALWRRLTQHLKPIQLVQATDREALLVLCDMWATYCSAMAVVREHGTLVTTRSKSNERAGLTVNPAWRVARDAARQMEGLWGSFGLTPADRARLTMGDGSGDTGDDLLT